MKKMINWLEGVKNSIDHEIHKLNELSEVKEVLLAELIEKVTSLDSYYMNYCDDMDDSDGEPPGTTYNCEYGPSIEFYIEADEWHEISKVIRKIHKLA